MTNSQFAARFLNMEFTDNQRMVLDTPGSFYFRGHRRLGKTTSLILRMFLSCLNEPEKRHVYFCASKAALEQAEKEFNDIMHVIGLRREDFEGYPRFYSATIGSQHGIKGLVGDRFFVDNLDIIFQNKEWMYALMPIFVGDRHRACDQKLVAVGVGAIEGIEKRFNVIVAPYRDHEHEGDISKYLSKEALDEQYYLVS